MQFASGDCPAACILQLAASYAAIPQIREIYLGSSPRGRSPPAALDRRTGSKL